MISENRRFLTLTVNDNKVYWGLLGIQDAEHIDLQEKKFCKYSSGGMLQLDDYTIRHLNWTPILNDEYTKIICEHRDVRYSNDLEVKEVAAKIDKGDYGFLIINTLLQCYYSGYGGWQKIIEIHAI